MISTFTAPNEMQHEAFAGRVHEASCGAFKCSATSHVRDLITVLRGNVKATTCIIRIHILQT